MLITTSNRIAKNMAAAGPIWIIIQLTPMMGSRLHRTTVFKASWRVTNSENVGSGLTN
jgi:hypothetical protein